MAVEIFANSAPVGVNLGEDGSTVKNLGPGTVFYNDAPTGTADGSIAPSATQFLSGLQFFTATARCSLTTTPEGFPSITVEGVTLFIGPNDPAVAASDGDVWINTA